MVSTDLCEWRPCGRQPALESLIRRWGLWMPLNCYKLENNRNPNSQLLLHEVLFFSICSRQKRNIMATNDDRLTAFDPGHPG